jgi:hypothetical protein
MPDFQDIISIRVHIFQIARSIQNLLEDSKRMLLKKGLEPEFNWLWRFCLT